MSEFKFFCPQCRNLVVEFHIPDGLPLTDDARQPVCRCPYCDAFIDDQVQAIFDLMIEGEELKELIWRERLRQIRSVNTYEEIVELWKRTPAPPEDE